MTPGQGRVAREFRTNMCKSATFFRNCTSTLVDCASTCASPQHPQLSLSLHTCRKAAHRRHSSQGPPCFSSNKTTMYFLSLLMYVMTPSRRDLQCWTRSSTCILTTQRKFSSAPRSFSLSTIKEGEDPKARLVGKGCWQMQRLSTMVQIQSVPLRN